LDARAKYQDSSLADLYDPLTMPADLVRAHHKLDAAVDAAYSKKNFSGLKLGLSAPPRPYPHSPNSRDDATFAPDLFTEKSLIDQGLFPCA
jgi:hypothetical protein